MTRLQALANFSKHALRLLLPWLDQFNQNFTRESKTAHMDTAQFMLLCVSFRPGTNTSTAV